MPAGVFTTFSQIEKGFQTSNVISHETFTFWFLETQNSLRRFLNARDENNYLCGFKSYPQLKQKIQDILRQIGYDDVSEIPHNITITYE